MKTTENRIIVSEMNIDKALNYINGISDKDYEKLIKRLIDEQQGLIAFSAFIKEQYGQKFFDRFLDIVIVIWQAFEDAGGKVPTITEEIFEKVIDKPEFPLDKIGELLNIKDEKKLQKKLEDFNRLISTAETGVEINKIKSQMGKDYEILLGFSQEYMQDINQKELFAFIMEESMGIKLSTPKKPQLEEMLTEELLYIMNCFDETVNFKSNLKVYKPGVN